MDDLPIISYSVEDAGNAVGLSRTRIFEAIKSGELEARKAGRATIIEADELRRWIKSMPVRKVGDDT